MQNYDTALRTVAVVINRLSSLVEPLLSNTSYFKTGGQSIDVESITGILTRLLEAQENKDYILLADLYEIQLIPFLVNLQETIISKEEFAFDEAQYRANIKAIGKKDSKLGAYLNSMPNPLGLLKKGYAVEYTSCGLMTLAIENNGKIYYMHSNNRVLNEAFTLAHSWYSEEKAEYIIYGLGLGYHIEELQALDSNISVEVYESDSNVIQLACAFTDIGRIINRPNIKLLFDPDFIHLMRRIGDMDSKTEFVLHYPSVRNIRKLPIKERLENYFIQYSSVKNQLHLLNGNFNENIMNYDGVVDELKEGFTDRDLYIIAAGPSLDKNFMQLKKVGKQGILLATGTVFRKLMKAGITPDYVIVTDANPRVYAQISGLEDSGIPMLFLSTAYKDFARNYKGKKYIIYQKDYHKAEEYAKRTGAVLYKTGGSVSTTALDIGINFNCKRIIFLGLDLAYTDNYMHAAGTSGRELTDTEELRQVEDIHGNYIYAGKSLDIYRQWIESRIKDVQETEFINATEGGAKIKGMTVCNLADIITETYIIKESL